MINNKYIELNSVLKAIDSLTKIDGYIRPEEFEAVIKSLPIMTMVEVGIHKVESDILFKKFEDYEDVLVCRALEELITYGYKNFPESFNIKKWKDDLRCLTNYYIKLFIGKEE